MMRRRRQRLKLAPNDTPAETRALGALAGAGASAETKARATRRRIFKSESAQSVNGVPD